jgi:hypothetical protein
MREVTIMCENRVGALADVCEALGGVGVNIRAISAQGVGGSGVIRLITEDENTARNVLEKAGFKISISDVVSVKLRDRPGELAKIARKLARSGVDLESVYIVGRINNEVEVVLKPTSVREAIMALKK